MIKHFLYFFIIGFIGVACSKEEKEPILPANQKPVVRKISPSSPSIVAKSGETVAITFLAADNEELARLEVEEIILTNVQYKDTLIIRNGIQIDSLISRGDTLRKGTILSKKIGGTLHTETITYKVPFQLPPLARIDIIAKVTDNIGQKAKTVPFYISIDFEKSDPLEQAFGISGYENINLYARNSRRDSSAYNLVGNRYSSPGNISDIDIQEFSDTNSSVFKRVLWTPATLEDSSLVVLNDAILNFNQLTYSIMRGAFLAHPQRTRTRRLNIGDIVIVKLRIKNANYNNWNHYAALRIKAILELGGKENYFVFDYKRSYSK
jgi:hypothetical protein